MNIPKQFALAGLLTLTFVGISLADDGYIIRTDPSVVTSLAKQFGLNVRRELGRGSGMYLVDVPPAAVEALKAHPLVQGVQSNSRISLPEAASAPKQSNLKAAYAPFINQPGSVAYKTQSAVNQIGLTPAQAKYGSGNTGITVAVIDTWLDAKHPALSGVVNTALAYDALKGTHSIGALALQETSPFIDQETSPFIDSATPPIVNQETSPFIDSTSSVVFLRQETSPFIDQETSPFIDSVKLKSPYVGHATMIGGFIHLIAPNVQIVPVIAVDALTGYGTMASIIDAINYVAGKPGSAPIAQVINMSFSIDVAALQADDAANGTNNYTLLQQAIANAVSKGVICVASVPNNGVLSNVAPAALPGVIGVGGVDRKNARASFSDYGPDVTLAAPGLDVISTFPFGKYALQSGDSFSTAFVSGAAALVRSVNPLNVAGNLESGADPVNPSSIPACSSNPTVKCFGYGALDVLGAIRLAGGQK